MGFSATGNPTKLTAYAFDCFLDRIQKDMFWYTDGMPLEYFAIIWEFFMICGIFVGCFIFLYIMKKKRIFELPYAQLLSVDFIFIFIFFQPSFVNLLVDSIACKRITGQLYLL